MRTYMATVGVAKVHRLKIYHPSVVTVRDRSNRPRFAQSDQFL